MSHSVKGSKLLLSSSLIPLNGLVLMRRWSEKMTGVAGVGARVGAGIQPYPGLSSFGSLTLLSVRWKSVGEGWLETVAVQGTRPSPLGPWGRVPCL